jgi:hypothetical protein
MMEEEDRIGDIGEMRLNWFLVRNPVFSLDLSQNRLICGTSQDVTAKPGFHPKSLGTQKPWPERGGSRCLRQVSSSDRA